MNIGTKEPGDIKITEEEGDCIEVWLTKESTPIAYERKKYELVHKSGMTEEEAEIFIAQVPFVLEIFYSIDQGLFAVESEALESCVIFNPYTGTEITNNNLPANDN